MLREANAEPVGFSEAPVFANTKAATEAVAKKSADKVKPDPGPTDERPSGTAPEGTDPASPTGEEVVPPAPPRDIEPDEMDDQSLVALSKHLRKRMLELDGNDQLDELDDLLDEYERVQAVITHRVTTKMRAKRQLTQRPGSDEASLDPEAVQQIDSAGQIPAEPVPTAGPGKPNPKRAAAPVKEAEFLEAAREWMLTPLDQMSEAEQRNLLSAFEFQIREAGRRHSARDLSLLAAIHDSIVELGLPCSEHPEDKIEPDDEMEGSGKAFSSKYGESSSGPNPDSSYDPAYDSMTKRQRLIAQLEAELAERNPSDDKGHFFGDATKYKTKTASRAVKPGQMTAGDGTRNRRPKTEQYVTAKVSPIPGSSVTSYVGFGLKTGQQIRVPRSKLLAGPPKVEDEVAIKVGNLTYHVHIDNVTKLGAQDPKMREAKKDDDEWIPYKHAKGGAGGGRGTKPGFQDRRTKARPASALSDAELKAKYLRRREELNKIKAGVGTQAKRREAEKKLARTEAEMKKRGLLGKENKVVVGQDRSRLRVQGQQLHRRMTDQIEQAGARGSMNPLRRFSDEEINTLDKWADKYTTSWHRDMTKDWVKRERERRRLKAEGKEVQRHVEIGKAASTLEAVPVTQLRARVSNLKDQLKMAKAANKVDPEITPITVVQAIQRDISAINKQITAATRRERKIKRRVKREFRAEQAASAA